MKVALRRSLRRPQNQFDAEVDKYPYDANGSSNFIMYSRPSAFGPPVLGALSGVINGMGDAAPHSSLGASAFSKSGSAFGGSNHGHNGPFTPPYYDGGAYCIFEFNPTENKKYTLDEIQSQFRARPPGVSGPRILRQLPRWRRVEQVPALQQAQAQERGARVRAREVQAFARRRAQVADEASAVGERASQRVLSTAGERPGVGCAGG